MRRGQGFTHIPGADKNRDDVRFTQLGVPRFHQLDELAEGVALLKEKMSCPKNNQTKNSVICNFTQNCRNGVRISNMDLKTGSGFQIRVCKEAGRLSWSMLVRDNK